jgi:hypothetical protein
MAREVIFQLYTRSKDQPFWGDARLSALSRRLRTAAALPSSKPEHTACDLREQAHQASNTAGVIL